MPFDTGYHQLPNISTYILMKLENKGTQGNLTNTPPLLFFLVRLGNSQIGFTNI